MSERKTSRGENVTNKEFVLSKYPNARLIRGRTNGKRYSRAFFRVFIPGFAARGLCCFSELGAWTSIARHGRAGLRGASAAGVRDA